MSRSDTEADAWLTLIRAPGLGARSLLPLLDRAGSAAAALALLRDRAAIPEIPEIPETARQSLSRPDPELLERDRAWLAGADHHLLTWLDPDYPALLRDTPRPPLALFVHGDPAWLWRPQIALVGSRNPTAGGRDHARGFAAELARSGFVITSGLASGIDAEAHEGALAAGAGTVAVIGTGIDLCYPGQHEPLMKRIAVGGAVVSEFAPGTPARAQYFPQRNRIIAGLSLGTLVVEAALRSGSLITARLAGESGREVFALPGSIHNPMVRGCHRLIREGAKLVETAGEIVDELRPLAQRLGERLRSALALDDSVQGTAPVSGAGSPQRLRDPDYDLLWQALGHDPQAVDVLVARTGLTTARISSMLLLMELDGLITVGANGQYGRAGRKAE